MSSPEIPPLIGALLRAPALAVQRRIILGLNQAGFPDLRQPHINVFLYPGPDGARPGVLAERAGMTKQAMNQLLQSLERLGYLRRGDVEGEAVDGRARLVYFTDRGQAAYDLIVDVLDEIELEWRERLGEVKFGQLKELLGEAWMAGLSD
jgi:DNA-binding MarR family transcriptional regulator